MKLTWSTVYCGISFLLIPECTAGKDQKLKGDIEVLPSNSNASFTDSSAIKLKLVENVNRKSTVELPAVTTNSQPPNASRSVPNNGSAMSVPGATIMGVEHANAFKNSSTSTPDPSANVSTIGVTSTPNSNGNFSRDIQRQLPQEKDEISSNISATTTSTVNTTKFSTSLASPTPAPEGDAQHTEVTESKGKDPASRRRLLVAVVKTLVTTSLSTATSTVFATCTTNDATLDPCTGRKKRRRQIHLRDLQSDGPLQESWALEPSLREASEWVPLKRSGRLIIWSSSVQTVTFFTTSTNTMTTVSISFACSFAGIPTLACA